MTTLSRQLVFGIYPGGAAGDDSGLLVGLPDDPAQINRCLHDLQGTSRPFVVRCYDSFQDPDSPLNNTGPAPANYAQYAISGTRPLELVLQFRSISGDVAGYLDFVRSKLEQHHQNLYAVQITEEPNFLDGPNVIDGPYPNVRLALTQGVVTAKQTLRDLGYTHVKVGFNTTPTFGPSAEFWADIKSLANEEFVESLDYVGLDFFPDVFRPTTTDGQSGDLASSAVAVLQTLRYVWLPLAGIPDHIPIHITEHGWPTSATRTTDRQANVLETVIRTIYDLNSKLNIERYTLFALRDVDHVNIVNNDNLFHFFGITTSDYNRKPAFDKFRSLIQELGKR
jgi:hypothetical protein